MLKILQSLIIGALALLTLQCSNPKTPETKEMWSVKTAQSFIKEYPNPDSIHWRDNNNHFSWQAGYMMFTMEKMWKLTGDSTYYNYISRYVDQQVDSAGNIPDFIPDALDNFIPGYAILFMYEQTQKEKYKVAADKLFKAFATYQRTSDSLFWHGTWCPNQVWVDGVYMGQIFMARYGKVFGNDAAFNEVARQMKLIVQHCKKPNGLLLHGWDESRKAEWADKTTGLAPEVWSEGLGWYAVLIADVLDYMPKTHSGYTFIQNHLKELCKGLKDSQHMETGMWCQVVDKPEAEGNWTETSGTGMFIYLIKKAIQDGWISKDEYEPIVQKAYNSIITKAKPGSDNFIDIIQCSSIGIKKDYKTYIDQPKEVNTFAGISSFILGTSVMELSRN